MDSVTALLDIDAHRRVGRQVGPFTLEEPLWSDPLYTVYWAQASMQERLLAFVFNASLEARLAGAFARSAWLANTAEHPSVPRVQHVITTDDDTPVVFVAASAGERLSSLMERRRGRVAPIDALRMLSEALEGLAKAHGVNLVHGFLSGGMLWATEAGSLEILGLGWGRLHAYACLSQSVRAGKTLDVARVADGHGRPEDDIAAMAAVAYELMSGEPPPFTVMGSDVGEQLVASDDVISFAQVAPHAPEELVVTLDELLANRATTLSAQALATRFRRIAVMPELALSLSLRARHSRSVVRPSHTATRPQASSPGVAKSAASPFLHHSEVARLTRREGDADGDEDPSASVPAGSGRYPSHEDVERITTRPSKKSV